MAKYRQLYTEFWSDSFVLELTPEEKYFYLYLISNSKSTQCGIYEISKRTIETDTGYNRETVEKLIQRFCHYEKILYCEETKELMVINWIKYNIPNSQNTIKCVQKEVLKVKNKVFVNILFNKCQKLGLDVDKIFENFMFKEKSKTVDIVDNSEIILQNQEKTDLKANKSQIENFEGACKGLGSNREEVISKKEKVISNKQVEEVITNKNNSEDPGLKNIIKIFEENVHAITQVEYEKILEFTNHVSSEVIILAIEEAVNYDAKNIKYISKVLDSWISLSLKTAEQVKSYQKKWVSKISSSKGNKIKKGGFCDYEQRSYDYDALEKRLLGHGDSEEIDYPNN